jgi:mannitol-1-phosphate/altronate dehydrogenase
VTDRIVVLGAGGLSLGFFGPELQDEYALTFVDTDAKADLIAHIQRRHEYATNVAGQKIVPLTIRPVEAFRLDLPEQDKAIREHIAQACIFFTAVGIRNLDSALLYLFDRIRGRTEPLFILCAENGEGVADKWRAVFPANIHLCDTVMGRMCRLDERAAPDYAPIAPELAWGVVGEDFHGFPLSDAHRDAKVFHSSAFQFMPEEEFHARERVKLYAHNGLHFFVAVMGRLRGAERFSDLAQDAEVTTATRELLEGEIAPALWKDCAWRIGRSEFDQYVARMPGRLFSPTLRDLVARGVRGIQEKFAENERALGGLRLLLRNGVRPRRYYDLLAAGLEVVRRDVKPEIAAALLRKLPGDEVRREVEARWKKLQ